MKTKWLVAIVAFGLCAGEAMAEWVCWPREQCGTGHYYRSSSGRTDWETARTQARKHGGYLAIPTSKAENDFIGDAFRGCDPYAAWLGGLQPAGSPEPAGGWRWLPEIRGECQWGWTNWEPGEPNNLRGEGCLSIYLNPASARDPLGCWNDLPDYYVLSYIVEKVPGDANIDGLVDGADYTAWAGNYGRTDADPWSQYEGGWTVGNFTEDTVVDGADYTVWADNYCTGPGGSSVPEPMALLLLLLGASAFLCRSSPSSHC